LNFILQRLLVNSISKLLTSLKLSNLLSSNLNLLLGSGVDTLAGGLLVNGESTETYELYFVTSYEGSLYSLNTCLKGLLCVNFGQTCTYCNLLN